MRNVSYGYYKLIFMKLFITFFLFRTRPVLVILKSIRDALFPYWVINAIHEGWRVQVPLVLVIVQFAKCAPSRRPVYRGNRNYFLRFFSRRMCARKANSVAMRPMEPQKLLVITFRRRSNWLACFSLDAPSFLVRTRATKTMAETRKLLPVYIDFCAPLRSTFDILVIQRNSIETNIECPWKYV